MCDTGWRPNTGTGARATPNQKRRRSTIKTSTIDTSRTCFTCTQRALTHAKADRRHNAKRVKESGGTCSVFVWYNTPLKTGLLSAQNRLFRYMIHLSTTNRKGTTHIIIQGACVPGDCDTVHQLHWMNRTLAAVIACDRVPWLVVITTRLLLAAATCPLLEHCEHVLGQLQQAQELEGYSPAHHSVMTHGKPLQANNWPSTCSERGARAL